MQAEYETNLSDEQWVAIRPLVEARVGRKATISRRGIANAILSIARTGCQWRLLPRDFPHGSTVYSCYHRGAWTGTLDKLHTALRDQVRQAKGKTCSPQPPLLIHRVSRPPQKGALLLAARTLETEPGLAAVGHDRQDAAHLASQATTTSFSVSLYLSTDS
jgi:transposase